MDFERYQKEALRSARIGLTPKEEFSHYSMGLAGESGEVIDYLKKVCWHEHELDVNHLKKELGDCLWYVAGIASVAGLSLTEVAEANIDKLNKRYPDGFSTEASINRVD